MAPGLVIQVSTALVGALPPPPTPEEGASPLPEDVLSVQEDQGPVGAGPSAPHLPIGCCFYPSPGCAGDKAQHTRSHPQELRADVSVPGAPAVSTALPRLPFIPSRG